MPITVERLKAAIAANNAQRLTNATAKIRAFVDAQLTELAKKLEEGRVNTSHPYYIEVDPSLTVDSEYHGAAASAVADDLVNQGFKAHYELSVDDIRPDRHFIVLDLK